MRKLSLPTKAWTLITLGLLLTAGFDSSAQQRKRKKKRKRNTTQKVNTTQTTTKDTAIAVHIPGVADKQAYDSLKAAAMKEKLGSDALVVSFVSLASGIDQKAEAYLKQIITEFNQKNNADILYDVKRWGREGERDYCLLSANKTWLDQLASVLKTEFENNRRVLIKQHSTCK